MRQEYYQDTWIQGKVVKGGDRNCSTRYPILENFCQRFNEHFYVLDFGCNMGYFSFRLASDFDCEVVMIDYEPKLPGLVEQNNMPNVSMVNKAMSVDETELFLSGKHFDLILAMSVLHHSKEPERLADLFIQHSDNVIFEIGYEKENKEIHDILQKKNPIQINSHIEHDRPIYYVNENEVNFVGNPHNGCGDAGAKTIPFISFDLKHKTGIIFFNGTLNTRLDTPITLTNRTDIKGYYDIVPMFINGFPVYNIMRNTIEYPIIDLELISPIKLRDKFKIYDNNQYVNISIDKKHLRE